MSGQDWIKHFQVKGINIGHYVQMILIAGFMPSKKGTVYNLVIVKGELFSDNNRTTSKIRENAYLSGMYKPENVEIACLVREMFTDEEIEKMGLYWIVTMHEPVTISGRCSFLLGMDLRGRSSGKLWFNVYDDKSNNIWDRETGFVFKVPQTK